MNEFNLELGNYEIDSEGFYYISKFLSKLINLSKLRIIIYGKNRIDDSAMEYLSCDLLKLEKLKNLYLKINYGFHISKDGTFYI